MRVWLAAVLPVLFAAMPTHAQGIDCSRARSATEKAICASPSLLALDHQVGVAYADRIARQPDRREALRQDLLAWLRARDTACNVPAGRLERCLSGQLTARLAALAPPDTAASAPPATPLTPPAPVTQYRTEAAAPPPDPAIPAASFAQPTPAATLDAVRLPAWLAADTLLHITSPGRVHHRRPQPIRRHAATGGHADRPVRDRRRGRRAGWAIGQAAGCGHLQAAHHLRRGSDRRRHG